MPAGECRGGLTPSMRPLPSLPSSPHCPLHPRTPLLSWRRGYNSYRPTPKVSGTFKKRYGWRGLVSLDGGLLDTDSHRSQPGGEEGSAFPRPPPHIPPLPSRRCPKRANQAEKNNRGCIFLAREKFPRVSTFSARVKGRLCVGSVFWGVLAFSRELRAFLSP